MTFFLLLSVIFTILINILQHKYYYQAQIFFLFRFSFRCYIKFNFLLMVLLPIVLKSTKKQVRHVYTEFSEFRAVFGKREEKNKSMSLDYSNLKFSFKRFNIHEVIQHSQIFKQSREKNPNIFYYVSPPDQGYDAITFNLDDYDFIINNEGMSVREKIKQLELKMLVPRKILDSSSNFYNYNQDLKRGGIDETTLFTDEARESVKSYLNFVLEHSEKFKEFDRILENNPYFPFEF